MAEQEIIRFGVSIGSTLLEKFDDLIEEKGYTNRSEAIRDLIRNKIVEAGWEQASDGHYSIGTVTIVYDHHTREIGDRLTEISHNSNDLIISSTHVHLTHSYCLEVILVKGCGRKIRAFADNLLSVRGVKHGKLVITGMVEDDQAPEQC